MRMNPPRYNGYEQGPDFDRARSQIATPFQYVDIDLSIAATNQVFDVSGDFLYLDQAGTGSATLELNNQYDTPAAPFFVEAGWAINAIFKRVKLSWTAQPGKFLRLMYSTGERVVPTNSTSINGLVNVVSSGEIATATASVSGVSRLASAPYPLIAAGLNPNGMIIVSVRAMQKTAVANDPGLFIMATSGAPGSKFAGIQIAAVSQVFADATYKYGIVQSTQPIFVPAGWGVYDWCSGDTSADNHSYRSAVYRSL